MPLRPCRLPVVCALAALALLASTRATLDAQSDVSITRGPYLQQTTATSTIIRWRTSVPSVGRVQYGTSPDVITWEASEASPLTDHKLVLRGLSPETTYYYSLVADAATIAGDSTYTFTTSPPAGVDRPMRAWIVGDSGTATANVRAVRDAYLAYSADRPTDLWLMLGDNAYTAGRDAEYQSAVFDMFPAQLRRWALWPTFGNHDGYSASSASQSGPYYSIFTLPKLGEAGGVPSNTEAYYSFDYGMVHFICLDSFGSARTPGSPMLTWLQNDLAATSQRWVVVFFHHPPYSKGSHDSDTDLELVEMRQYVAPILEAGGADLVLSGHSHSYERSFLIDGHYGSSSTFDPAMKKDGGDGRLDGTGAYVKPTDGRAPHEGTVYVVAGTSGQVEGGALNHPAMYTSLSVLGSVVLDVNGSRLDATFIDSTGARRDYFTIMKGGAPAPPTPAAPTTLVGTPAATSVSLAWTDNASNETGFQVERRIDGVAFRAIATTAANTSQLNDTGLVNGRRYYYRVRAFNQNGASGYSNELALTTGSGSAAPPSAPVDLSATSTTKGAMTVRWTDASSDESGFEIQRCIDGVSFRAIATVGVNVPQFNDTGLVSGRQYYYRVRAYRGTTRTYSGFSNVATAASQ